MFKAIVLVENDMIDVQVYSFPTKESSAREIEQRYCELHSKYRDGEKLDEIEFDWMNSANNWLSER